MKTGENIIRRAKSILKILTLCIIMLFLLPSCGKSEEDRNKEDTGEENKPLLEQAVDWCKDNGNLLEGDGEYKSYTLQTKEADNTKYNFLYWEDGSWGCELYYIQTDGDQVKKVTALNGGNKEQFSYDVVKLFGENYAAVYCASHMGNGELMFFPLDKENGSAYTIEGAIDHHYEAMDTVDENGIECMTSQIYYNGKLTADYKDVNEDGFTDIVLTGIILTYTGYQGEEYFNGYGQLTDSKNCTRTYLYNESTDQFEESEEVLDSICGEDGKSYEYTGYLDICPGFAEDNPEYDYDGDGLSDRIYKQFNSEEGTSSFYLYFGKGDKLRLTNQSQGIFYKTEAVDMTGDGVKEILFEQFSTSTKCQNLYIYIYTLKDGSYERMDIPYYGEPDENDEEDGMLYLPLIMKKVSDSSVSIYQPDSGYKGIITAEKGSSSSGETYDEMANLYYAEIEGKEENYQASEMQFVDTEDESKKAFLFRSYLGDKWCIKSVYWKLEYVKGEWKITDIEQADPIRLDVGAEFSTDLNGDKTEDTVYYDIRTTSENGMDYEIPYLKINGTEYTDQYLMDNFEVFVVSCSRVGYYITDIDVTDSYREIAILDEGPSNDPVTYFFRFTGKELQYCGMVTDLPSNTTFLSNGNGSITARKRLGILQTWWADATWKLNQKNYLEEQPQEIYYPYQYETDESTTNHAKQDIKLYKNMEKNSDTVTIKKGEVITLTATDNKNWIQVTSESGITGWFYLQEDNKVILPTGEAEISDIVSYLCMAD